MMIKGSIQKGVTIMYTSNIGTLKSKTQILIGMNRERDGNTITVRYFSTQFLTIASSSRQKIDKETLDLNCI